MNREGFLHATNNDSIDTAGTFEATVKDNFAADREAAESTLQVPFPDTGDI